MLVDRNQVYCNAHFIDVQPHLAPSPVIIHSMRGTLHSRRPRSAFTPTLARASAPHRPA